MRSILIQRATAAAQRRDGRPGAQDRRRRRRRPAGLLSAIALARRGWAVDVFERGAAPPASSACWGAGERSYQLGLNGRGQKALRRFGVMDRVDARAASVRGRLSIGADGNLTETRLTPPGEPGAEKSYVTRVMQRDRLQACLLEAVGDYERVAVHFGVACDGVGLGDRPTLALDPPRERTWDLVVGADGVNSHVRAALEGAPGSTTRCVRFENRNERRYRTIPLHPSRVPGTPTDLNWGFRNASAGLGMDALPTLEGEMVAVLLFKPDSPVSRRLAALETADDGARAVKPYFGQGANSALEDVAILDDCLDDAPDAAGAAALFSERRAEDARALVRISRGFDGRGPLGTARFLAPLLLDAKLSKAFPRLFSPPLLRAIQNEDNSFHALRVAKRRERCAQAAARACALAVGRALCRAAFAHGRRALVGRRRLCAATLAVCACGSELPEWDDDWDADRPAVHHLDPEDCVAPVPDDRTLEAELAVDEPAPRAWTAPVADAAREAERLRASRAAEVAESEKVFLGEFRAMLGAGVRLVVRPSAARAAPAGAAVVAATLGLADDERSVEWSLDGGAATTRSSTGGKKPLKDVSNSMNTRKRSSQKKNATKKTKAQPAPAPAAPGAREPSTEASPTLARAAASLLVLAVLTPMVRRLVLEDARTRSSPAFTEHGDDEEPVDYEPATESSPTLARAAASLFLLAVLVSQTLIWLVPSAAPAAAPAVAPAAAPKKIPLRKLAIAAGAAGALASPHVGTARAVGSALMMSKEVVPIRSIAPIFTAARRGPVAIILSIWRFVRGIVGFAAL
ncbi:FAD binding protein [Aureococcus anophagefferens]|nr:FAD binding protein [Aureococcus anophagefferens]